MKRRARSALGAGAFVLIGLAAASAYAWRATEPTRRTRRTLTDLVDELHDDFALHFSGSRSSLEDVRNGQPWLLDGEGGFYGENGDDASRVGVSFGGDVRPCAVDAWGRPIRFRAPGPRHRAGWDIWSFGPNGVDEQGEGDDLLVGEDVAFETSAR